MDARQKGLEDYQLPARRDVDSFSRCCRRELGRRAASAASAGWGGGRLRGDEARVIAEHPEAVNRLQRVGVAPATHHFALGGDVALVSIANIHAATTTAGPISSECLGRRFNEPRIEGLLGRAEPAKHHELGARR